MDKALQTMIDNMPSKTGKPLSEWKEILQAKQFAKHGEAVKFLKTEHGVTHGFANTIVTLSKEENTSPEDLVATQYQGKENLKPIYDALITHLKGFGADISLAPKKAYVSVRRKKQFAILQPSTKTRLDLGINLKGKEPEDKLEASGSFNAMVSHRVKITDIAEIDAQIVGWLKEAYDLA